MSEPSDPKSPTSAPKGVWGAYREIAHKVAREVVNAIGPPGVRILLEPPVEPQDNFVLGSPKPSKPKSTRLDIGTGHFIVEFEHVHEKTDYEFSHSRASIEKGGPEREVIDSRLSGSNLFHVAEPKWKTPGEPSKVRKERDTPQIPKARRNPPPARDSLLDEEVTKFEAVQPEEPKMEG